MDESNVEKAKEEIKTSFYDDIVKNWSVEGTSTQSGLKDPCERFILSIDKIYSFDRQSTQDIADLWMRANKTSCTHVPSNGLYVLMGQSKDEVDALLKISEAQGERKPGSVVEIRITEHEISQIKKHMQQLDSLHDRMFDRTPSATPVRKRQSKYQKLLAKYTYLEKRVIDLEELCKQTLRKI